MSKHSSREEYNAYMREYMLKRYHRLRQEAITQLGGKCTKCGSVDDLEIDHKDPSKKKFDFGRQHSMSAKARAKELAKCQLLCDRCHNLKTVSDRGYAVVKGADIHGTLSALRYCKPVCMLCKAAKKAVNAVYNARPETKAKKRQAYLRRQIRLKRKSGKMAEPGL